MLDKKKEIDEKNLKAVTGGVDPTEILGNITNSPTQSDKLSAGLRLDRTGDNSAGLAISENMKGDIIGLEGASRNAQDSINLVPDEEESIKRHNEIMEKLRSKGII